MRKRLLLLFLACATIGWSQRYVTEVFANFNVTADVTYATNIDFLTSDLSNQQNVGQDLTAIKTALAQGNPIPPQYFDPTDQSTDLKVTNLKMDVYEPAGDTMAQRPVVIFLHTGNFLPPRTNGSITGSRKDSSAIVACRKLARRGFVAIAASYRLGWNPLASTQVERRAQLLNAVYRAIQDAKQCVRTIKADAKGANTYGIDPNKITLYGSGSGGYVALAYATLDKFSEVTLPKFTNPQTGNSFIDTNLVGNFEGFGGAQSLTLYAPNGESSDIDFVMNMGGALADTSWMAAGDPPMVAVQCVRDPFAPYDEGTVVVPTTQEDVVDVQGANIFIEKANNLGNNTYNSRSYNDPISQVAKSRYGNTYDYIFPAPFDKITLNQNLNGHFPIIKPLPTPKTDIFANQGSPWQWWDPNGPIASDTLDPGPPVITYHMAGLRSNPGMSPQQGRAYLDTILNYASVRIATSLSLGIGLDEHSLAGKVELFPNPVNEVLRISLNEELNLQSVDVMDLTGRMIRNIPLQEGQTEVELSDLTTGAYIIRLEAEEGTLTKKILKN